jgi:hypothetical protein
LTAALLLVLALMSFGCASVSSAADPAASTNLSLSPELEQAKITKNSDEETPLGWELFYELVNLGGTLAASNSPETPSR